MEISPHIHQVPGVMANVFLLVDTNGLALIDAGLPGSHKKILKYLASLGYGPADLKYILLTHADSDHVGGLAEIQAATRAHTYTSPVEANAIRAGSRPSGVPPRTWSWFTESLMCKSQWLFPS